MKITVPYLNRADIEKSSLDVLSRSHPQRTVPVPVDLIIERDCGIDIVPIAGLREELENGAFISRDFTTIYVDQHVYFNVEVRYRFSLAHELGHLVLHRQPFQELVFESLEEWAEVYQSIEADDYSRLEYQANMFAGFLLIPDFALASDFPAALDSLKGQVEKAKKAGLMRETYLGSVVGSIARKLAPSFNVSTICMENRLKSEEKCMKLIP